MCMLIIISISTATRPQLCFVSVRVHVCVIVIVCVVDMSPQQCCEWVSHDTPKELHGNSRIRGAVCRYLALGFLN